MSEPERSARGTLREFIDSVLSTGEPTDAVVLTQRAQEALGRDPLFTGIAARQYIAEWTPRLLADEAHRSRTPGTIRHGLSEEAYRRAVLRKWEGFRVTVADGQTKVLLDCIRPELGVDLERRREQLAYGARFVDFGQEIWDRLPDDETTVGSALDEEERLAIWDHHFKRGESA